MTGLRLILTGRTPDPMPPVAPRASVLIERAMCCAECDSLFEADPAGCPACGSRSAWPLAAWIGSTRQPRGVQ